MYAARPPAESGDRLVLALNHIDDLFVAPALNPFSDVPVEILGEAGVEYLHKRIQLRWPRAAQIAQLTIQLPPAEPPNAPGAGGQLAAETQAALRRYCEERVEHNRELRRFELGLTWRKLAIAGVATLVAVLVLLALVNGLLDTLNPFPRGMLIALSLFSASLTIWDALERLFFGWVPYSIGNRAYRVLGGLSVNLTVHPEDGARSPSQFN
jgi:hypothetical protein